jgi:hypothetical protein
MAYRITGLNRHEFEPLFGLDDEVLAARSAMRVTATADKGFPCRISLQDAKAGETLLLLNHTSHDVATPFRSSYAIYVREAAEESAAFEDALPPVFEGRPLGLRAFDGDGMLRNALLAAPGEADSKIRALFADDTVAYIDAHNAAHGCFAARVERA